MGYRSYGGSYGFASKPKTDFSGPKGFFSRGNKGKGNQTPRKSYFDLGGRDMEGEAQEPCEIMLFLPAECLFFR